MRCAKARAQLGEYLEAELDVSIRTRLDAHLADCQDCALELRALRSTVAQLRSLSVPEPPADLVQAVMKRIEAGESRPRLLSTAARRVFDPRVALPLAAGVAGLMLLTTMNFSPMGEPAESASTAAVQRLPKSQQVAMRANRPQKRLAKRALARPRLGIERLAARRFFRPKPGDPVGMGLLARTDPDIQQLDLDAQLDGALRNPMGFLRRVDAIEEIERVPAIAPLVVRADYRGDAAVVAQRFRSISHPLAPSMAASFERTQRGRATNSMATPVSHLVTPAVYR